MSARERKERVALLRRLEDIARGVSRAHFDLACATTPEDGVGISVDLGAEGLAGFILAVSGVWMASNGVDPEPGRVPPVYFEMHNLAEFDRPLFDVADWLYGAGARAEVVE